MNLSRRFEALEAVVRRHQEDPDPADLSRLSADELRDFEGLRAIACGEDDRWDLKKLSTSELKILRAVLKTASVSDGEECSRNDALLVTKLVTK